MFCQECGYQLGSDQLVCPVCGTTTENDEGTIKACKEFFYSPGELMGTNISQLEEKVEIKQDTYVSEYFHKSGDLYLSQKTEDGRKNTEDELRHPENVNYKSMDIRDDSYPNTSALETMGISGGMYCPNCGNKRLIKCDYCYYCGASFQMENETPNMEREVVEDLLPKNDSSTSIQADPEICISGTVLKNSFRDNPVLGILAGVAFASLAVLGFIRLVQIVVSISQAKITVTSENVFPFICLIAVVILYFVYVVGFVLSSYGHIINHRMYTKYGAATIMTGYCGVVIIIVLYLLILLKGDFTYLFSNDKTVVLFLAVVVKMFAFTMYDRLAIAWFNMKKIGNSYLLPIILAVISDVILVAIMSYSNREISVIDTTTLLSPGVINEIVFLFALILSCLFIHFEDIGKGNNRYIVNNMMKDYRDKL